jgi:NADH:ubiquinone oxidoreductase subunit 5 (subunit L)/multisubunit Na+/H+ antiporter MnhA subunit
LGVALFSALLLILNGPATSLLIGIGGIGLSARLDAVSAVMLLLVSFVGWVVLRFAATYMDGEARQGSFTGWLCATLAAVMLLVIAGNTAATGAGLDRDERVSAQAPAVLPRTGGRAARGAQEMGRGARR